MHRGLAMYVPRGMIFGRGDGLEICQLHALPLRTDRQTESGHYENYIPRSSVGRRE